MSYHISSCIISYHIISYHIVSYHIISFHFISFHIMYVCVCLYIYIYTQRVCTESIHTEYTHSEREGEIDRSIDTLISISSYTPLPQRAWNLPPMPPLLILTWEKRNGRGPGPGGLPDFGTAVAILSVSRSSRHEAPSLAERLRAHLERASPRSGTIPGRAWVRPIHAHRESRGQDMWRVSLCLGAGSPLESKNQLWSSPQLFDPCSADGACLEK